MRREQARQRARRKRALARKVGHAMDGLLHLSLSPEALRDANDERVRRALARVFPSMKQETFLGGGVDRFNAWISRRLRYRNRKAYSTARRCGIPRWSVGRGLTLVSVNGSTMFVSVTVRGAGSIDVVTVTLEGTP